MTSADGFQVEFTAPVTSLSEGKYTQSSRALRKKMVSLKFIKVLQCLFCFGFLIVINYNHLWK